MDKRVLKVLLAEDNPADAELILRELRQGGFAPDWQRVDTEADFLSSLHPEIDIILSDYAMPQFSGVRALQLAKQQQPDIPFILVSGTIGEDIAVAAMRDGAADYLLKDRLGRLDQAVRSALEEKRIRSENKRTQETFERLRRDYELILNSAGEGICGVDLDGKISFANPRAGKLLGYNTNELLGKTFRKIARHTVGEGGAAEGDAISDSMAKGGTRRVTNDLFHGKNGRPFHVDYVCAPIRDERGCVTGTIITFKDISEQFNADVRLRLQAEQYRLLFDTNPNPMWVYATKSLQVLAANQAAIAEYGYSRDEFLRLTIKELRPAQEIPELLNAMTSPRMEAHFSGEFRHVKKDGSPILVEIYSSPIVWETVSARMVTAIDVTERKQAEERMRQQAEIINGAHDAVVIRNFKDDRITFWNHGAERIYGWRAEEAVGKTMAELIFQDSTCREPLLEQLTLAGEYHGEVKHRTKEGRDVIVDSRATVIPGDDGLPLAVLGINTDITERKKLEMQLLRAQRLESIGTLAGGVAHDLNNILTPILMCAQNLHADPDDEDRESAVTLIEQCARRGASIVKQVLTFARGIEGQRVLIKPGHLIEEMIDIARETFPKSIEIRGGYARDLWSIEADPTQLHQVLLNLSVNARDAMPEGGSLVISAENFTVDEHYASVTPEARPGSYIELRVTDSGDGMTRATIDKIFDPFFTTKELGKGTGLGLSTTVGIVKSHGGFLSVESELGKGTTFRVFLPARPDDIAPSATETSMELVRGHSEKVLIVDDEQPILEVTRMALEQCDYEVLTAHDGPEALAIFTREKNSISALLTDIQLPHMDGVSLIRAVKKMRPDVVTVASTGQDEDLQLEELRDLGVIHMLSKPYDTQKLLTTLRDALREPNAVGPRNGN